jgi:hypothetical protein
MKVFAGLMFAALMVAGNAGAATFTVNMLCNGFNGTFGFSYASPIAPNANVGSSTGTCNGLDVSGVANIVAGSLQGFILLDNDFAGPQAATITTSTTWSITGITLAAPLNGGTPDTLTTNTNDAGATVQYTDSIPLAGGFHNATTLNGTFIQPGFYDNMSISGLTVANFNYAYTNAISNGSTQNNTGYARVVYTYQTQVTTGGTPEPVSMLLFGGGLVAVSLIVRKKRAAR